MVFENNGENMDAVTNFFDRNDDGALSVQGKLISLEIYPYMT